MKEKRILMVDDSPLVHQIYGDQLEEAGFEVLHAMDGINAINMAFAEMPDLIVLDIHMPKINGYQVCRLLKDQEATKHIPIVILTTQSSPGKVIEDPREWSFETGADSYVDKDFEGQLVEIIQPLLDREEAGHVPAKKQKPLSETDILLALSALLDKQLYLDVTRLKELDERKNAFVANVSHEFRSPMTILKGNYELLYNEALGPLNEKQKKAMENSNRTIDRLIRLVTDLLDLAKIEAGKMELKKEEFDMLELLDEVLESYKVVIDEKKIKTVEDYQGNKNVILGDRDRLTQVLINILSNSVKFTPEGGQVTLRLSGSDSELRLEIEDNGPGMSQDGLKKIFDKFERITAEKREGTGLGLPIAKDIVVLHGGRIWAESEEGKGSKFIVILPRQNA